jgi:hypothetical protein
MNWYLILISQFVTFDWNLNITCSNFITLKYDNENITLDISMFHLFFFVSKDITMLLLLQMYMHNLIDSKTPLLLLMLDLDIILNINPRLIETIVFFVITYSPIVICMLYCTQLWNLDILNIIQDQKNTFHAHCLTSFVLKFDLFNHITSSKNWLLTYKFSLLCLHCNHLSYVMNFLNNHFDTSKFNNKPWISAKPWAMLPFC